MKKYYSIFTIALTAMALMLMPNVADAQSQEGDVKLGVGLAYGSGVGFGSLDNDLGIRVDGYYGLTNDIRLGADFTFYLPKSESGVDLTVWELGLNGNYLFVNESDLIVYALAGINITGVSMDFGNGSSSSSEMGLNLGGGVEYDLDFADLFGELKLAGLGGDADQFTIGAGLRFPL